MTDFTQMREPKSATKAPAAPEASVDMSHALGGSDSEGEEVEQGSRALRQSNKENEVRALRAEFLGVVTWREGFHGSG